MQEPLTVSRALNYVFLIVAGFIMIYPVLYLVLAAFTTDERFFEASFLPLPNKFNLEFLGYAWEWMQRAYVVTLLRVGLYLVLTLLVGIIAGYIFSKMRFPGRNQVFFLLLTGLVMPAILMIVPQYLLAARFPLAAAAAGWGRAGMASSMVAGVVHGAAVRDLSVQTELRHAAQRLRRRGQDRRRRHVHHHLRHLRADAAADHRGADRPDVPDLLERLLVAEPDDLGQFGLGAHLLFSAMQGAGPGHQPVWHRFFMAMWPPAAVYSCCSAFCRGCQRAKVGGRARPRW
jgi:hypothetical protein